MPVTWTMSGGGPLAMMELAQCGLQIAILEGWACPSCWNSHHDGMCLGRQTWIQCLPSGSFFCPTSSFLDLSPTFWSGDVYSLSVSLLLVLQKFTAKRLSLIEDFPFELSGLFDFSTMLEIRL